MHLSDIFSDIHPDIFQFLTIKIKIIKNIQAINYKRIVNYLPSLVETSLLPQLLPNTEWYMVLKPNEKFVIKIL